MALSRRLLLTLFVVISSAFGIFVGAGLAFDFGVPIAEIGSYVFLAWMGTWISRRIISPDPTDTSLAALTVAGLLGQVGMSLLVSAGSSVLRALHLPLEGGPGLAFAFCAVSLPVAFLGTYWRTARFAQAVLTGAAVCAWALGISLLVNPGPHAARQGVSLRVLLALLFTLPWLVSLFVALYRDWPMARPPALPR